VSVAVDDDVDDGARAELFSALEALGCVAERGTAHLWVCAVPCGLADEVAALLDAAPCEWTLSELSPVT
jgi:hypothetical protein